MNPDIPIYAGIVAAIAVLVAGFTIWKKAKPTSRGPERALCLCVLILCGAALIWTSIQAVLVWRDTGINTMRSDYWRFAKLGALTIGAGLGYRTWRKKERQEQKYADEKKA